MNNYENKGSVIYLTVILGTLIMFIPFAITTVGCMRVYSKIRGVFKNEKQAG